jgi:undecaprenyl-diphosphatase
MDDFTFRLDKKRIGIELGIVAAIYAVLFTIVAIVGDYNATLAINQWAGTFPTWYISLVKFYTDYGPYIFGAFGIVCAIPFFFSKKLDRLKSYRPMFLGLLFGYSVSAFITGSILKPLVGRTRPYIQYDKPQPPDTTPFNTYGENATGYSFPSGHATAAFGMTGPLMARLKNWIMKILVYAYAITLALSRPFFGVHYVTDILVGSIVGLTCSIGFYLCFEYLASQGKLSDRREKILFGVGLVLVILTIFSG